MDEHYELDFKDGQITFSQKNIITPLIVTHDIDLVITNIKKAYNQYKDFGINMENVLNYLVTGYINCNYKSSKGKVLGSINRNTTADWEIIFKEILHNLRQHIYQKLDFYLNAEYVDSKLTFDIDNDAEVTGSIILVLRNVKDSRVYQFVIIFNRHLNITITSKPGILIFK